MSCDDAALCLSRGTLHDLEAQSVTGLCSSVWCCRLSTGSACPLRAMGVMVDRIVASSAAPALALLEEQEPTLQAHALSSLDVLADSFWPEISGAVDRIQELSESTSFAEKDLASLVVAKVLFHLGELDEALRYALAAGSRFDVDADTEFANTLRSRCIDEYIAIRSSSKLENSSNGSILLRGTTFVAPSRSLVAELASVVERVLDGCIRKGEVHEAIGVAIETRRLDKLQQAVLEGCKTDEARSQALDFCFECAQTLVTCRQYRTTVLNLIADIHLKHFDFQRRNHIAVANCLAFTHNAQAMVDTLLDLISDEKNCEQAVEDENELTALQIAFDVVDNDEPHLAMEICDLLPETTPESLGRNDQNNAVAGSNDEGRHGEGDLDVVNNSEDVMETEAAQPADAASGQDVQSNDTSNSGYPLQASKQQRKLVKLKNVLSGKVTAEQSLDFLCSHNHSDSFVLKKIKQSLDGRSSVCHSALVFANAIAHSGTAIDTFLRENLDWLARASAWAKFSATSCLGVIHARHTSSALILLSPYLPSSAGPGGPTSASAFSEGGALYALGLIAATGGRNVKMPSASGESSDAKDYLFQALRSASTNDIVQHGACLGLGLSAMASWDGNSENEIYEELNNVLGADSAVAGEAAGLSIGLLALGSGSEVICSELLEHARESQHEKVVRGLAIGMALILYGREDDAQSVIDIMIRDKDPILRYGGMYAIALAFCGTADNKAIRQLLHSAVSDINDDVRRAAVIAIGFVLFRHPKQVPRIVALLSESCHAHVRYGAAMAIGIACTGTGLGSAVEILERLTTDSTDFVRQGALIALALVFMHHTEERSPKAAEMRKLFETTWSAKMEDAVTRFGAVIASGIIDAGGKNGFISLASSTGHRRMSAIVGMAMFTQFWYWFPLVHFIALSIKPSAMIGLNKDLKMPKFDLASDASVGLFEYTPSGPPEVTKELTRAPAAVLSVTAKSKAREMRRAAARKSEGSDSTTMDVEEYSSSVSDTDSGSASVEAEGKVEETDSNKDGEDDSASKEKQLYAVLSNPCRVLPGQEKHLKWTFEKGSFKLNSRYLPIKQKAAVSSLGSMLMLRDLRKGELEEFVEMKSLAAHGEASSLVAPTEDTSAAASLEQEDDDDDDIPESELPASFEYTDED